MDALHGPVELIDEPPAVEVTWAESDAPHAVFHYRFRLSTIPSPEWLNEFVRPERWVPYPKPTDYEFSKDLVYFATSREDLRLKLLVLKDCLEQANAAFTYRRERADEVTQVIQDRRRAPSDLAEEAAREAGELLRSL